MKLIQYVETIEVVFSSITQQRFYFCQRPSLEDKTLIYFLVNDASVTHSPENREVVQSTIRMKAYVVLVSKDKEIINRYPLRYFESSHTMPNPILVNKIIDWEKSYVELSNLDWFAGLEENRAFIFTLYCSEKARPVFKGVGLNIETVEVRTKPAILNKYYLPDIDNLRGKIINNIESTWYSVLKTPSGLNLANMYVLGKSYLTMVTGDNEKIRRLPLENLNMAGYEGWKPFFDIIPDFPKSYIEIPNIEETSEDEAYLLFFYYWDKIIRR